MASRIAGVDFSTIAIHISIVPLEEDHGDPSCPPLELRAYTMPRFKPATTTAQYRSVARARAIHEGAPPLFRGDEHPIVSVWIETPFGANRKSDAPLREAYGAILASIPQHITIASISANEWRDHLHLRPGYTKQVGIGYAAAYAIAHHVPVTTDEHWAEGVCLALAGRSQWHTDHTAAA